MSNYAEAAPWREGSVGEEIDGSVLAEVNGSDEVGLVMEAFQIAGVDEALIR